MNDIVAFDKLASVKQAVTDQEFSQLSSIKEELMDSWHKRQIFRTMTEARYGVLNDFKFPTNAGKYWQSVREQMVHFDELTSLSFDLRRKKINLAEIDSKLNDQGVALSVFERDRLLIDRDELLFQISAGTQVAKDRVREVMQWSELKAKFNDGSFDDKDVNTHQAHSLFAQVLNRNSVATPDMPSEERLTINGILFGLKDNPTNQELIRKLQEKEKTTPQV